MTNLIEVTGENITVPEPEVKTETWRVLRRDEGLRWHELEPITGTSQYSYQPSATDLGEKYGEGDYIILKAGSAVPSYLSARTISVIADRYFREKEDDQEEGAEA